MIYWHWICASPLFKCQMILFLIQDAATSNPRGAVRRHSLLSQTSIKRLFKWKARSFIVLRSFLSPNIFDFNSRCILCRSSDPSSRRQSDTNEASRLTNNHYFFSSEEGKIREKLSIWAAAGCYSVPEPSLAGGEPYNTTMQCYCGQNSCPLCNLLLNLQITNTGID